MNNLRKYDDFVNEMVISPGMTSGNFSVGSDHRSSQEPITHFTDIFRKSTPLFSDIKENEKVSIRAKNGKRYKGIVKSKNQKWAGSSKWMEYVIKWGDIEETYELNFNELEKPIYIDDETLAKLK